MENKMPFLGNINCRNLRKKVYHLQQEALGENMGVTRRVVQKYINVLKEAGRIERVGGKRYGHWKIND